MDMVELIPLKWVSLMLWSSLSHPRQIQSTRLGVRLMFMILYLLGCVFLMVIYTGLVPTLSPIYNWIFYLQNVETLLNNIVIQQ